MFANYLKTAFRNLLRYKVFSAINIVGLAVGMASTILIFLWVQDELSVDTFHRNAAVLYRVIELDADGRNSRSPALLGPALAAEIPEVDAFTRVFKLPRLVFKHDKNIFYEDKGIIVDPRFLTLFDFPLVRGDAATALDAPSHMIITETLAKKYFGDEDPLNKTIQIDGKNEVIIAGVVKDLPGRSHLQFDFIMPFSLLEILNPSDINNWGAFNYTTYLQLKSTADVKGIADKINVIAAARIPPPLLPFWKKFELQSLSECYLSADVDNHQFLGSFTVAEDRNTVYMFSMIAFVVLLLACINSMNLSTARSATRMREIGIKKVVGSSRAQLVMQFVGESALVSSIAFVLALVMVELILPYYNQVSGKELLVSYLRNGTPYVLIVLLIAVLAGLYPALYLSSFQPAETLKDRHGTSSIARRMRAVLVVFQFAIAIALISGAGIVYLQMKFIHEKNLGFQKENIVYVPIGGAGGTHYETMKNELLKNPNILAVSAKDCLPTTSLRTLVDFYWDEKVPGQSVLMELTGVDYDYFEALNINVIEGRAFSHMSPTDAANAFVLNQEAVRQTGLKDAVGKKFATYNKSGVIIGVIKNTNFKSLHETVRPQVYHVMNNIAAEGMFTGVMLVKIQGTGQSDALSSIKNVWNRINPDVPFEFHFLDQAYEQLYSTEQRTQVIFNWFCVVALVIASLGLYGLASFTAENRRREIGIRKTLGADVKTIVVSLTVDFVKLVLLANFIAWPLAWFVMNKWLQDFAYRTDMPWWIFSCAGMAALAIAMAAVGFRALRAAMTNPVEALRHE